MGTGRPRDPRNSGKVYVRPESKTCPGCGRALEYAWNNDRHVRFIGGPKHIDYHVYACRNPKCPLFGVARKPEALSVNVLDGYEVGLEVISLIGYYRLKMGMSYQKIRDVASLGIPVAGVATDGEPVVVEAVGLALPGVPHQLCQFHTRTTGELERKFGVLRANERSIRAHTSTSRTARDGAFIAAPIVELRARQRHARPRTIRARFGETLDGIASYRPRISNPRRRPSRRRPRRRQKMRS